MYNLYRSPATFYECLMITATQKNIVLPPDRINFKNMDKKEFKETHKHLLE